MRQKLFNFNNNLIKGIFYFLFSLTFYFALTSSNLILGDNHVTKIGTTFFTTTILIILMVIGLAIYAGDNFRNFLTWIFIDKRWITSSIILFLTILIQIFFVLLVHPGIGFDVGGIHYGLLDPKDINTIGYFSVNPNNLNMLLLQHWIASIFHNTSWLFFDLLTLFLVDISSIINLLSISVISKNKVPIGMYIHSLWLILFPMIIVPYTDTWVLPFISLYIFCYCLIGYSDKTKKTKIMLLIVMGLSLTGAYFIKPSGIIPAIAIAIIELLHLLKTNSHQWKWIIICVSLLSISTLGSYHLIDQSIKNQTYIHVNSFRAKPMIHFINMGLSGDGGYNAKDSFKIATTVNKQARIDYSVKSIKKRLKKKGFWGYQKFLIRKQNNNTADGTFAWVKEGDFIHKSPLPAKSGIKGKLENFLYLYGNNLGDFRYIAQIWWCIWLGIIFFSWHDDRKLMQVLRLAIVGGFIFLLLFEGGRSRYLIQFLPVFLLLATFGFDSSVKEIHRLLGWTQNETVHKPTHLKRI